jgi:hypothetical protein
MYALGAAARLGQFRRSAGNNTELYVFFGPNPFESVEIDGMDFPGPYHLMVAHVALPAPVNTYVPARTSHRCAAAADQVL